MEALTEDNKISSLPWVCANIALPHVAPYRVVKVGKWRVAVTSLMVKEDYAAPKRLQQPSSALRDVLKRLPEVDATILLLPSPAKEVLSNFDRIDLVLGGVFGRGENKKQKPPYLLWLRMPKGGQIGLVTLEKGQRGVQLVSFKLHTLDSKVPADPQMKKEISALAR